MAAVKHSRREIRKSLKNRSSIIKNKVKSVLGSSIENINFSYIDLFTVLFFQLLNHNPEKLDWAYRDRLVISNVNTVPSLLAVLWESNYINRREFQELLSSLPKFFTNKNLALIEYPGVDFITSSPYLGMIQSIGYSIAGKNSRQKFRAYHILSDKRTAKIQEILLASSNTMLNNISCALPFVDLHRRSATIQFWYSMGWQIEEVKFDDTSYVFEGYYRSLHSANKPQVLIG